MTKIAKHPTVVIEEGGAALPIKKFILQVGETLPGTVRQKLETELRDDKIWTESLIPVTNRLIKDILD